MIPRLHKRGTSFKGACGYILHDPKTTSRDRVLWTETCNLFSKADDAWFEMFATARDQAELKQQSGHDARGRKNTKPVLHVSISWALTDNPTHPHMLETAKAALNAMGLADHQAVIAAHGDKQHLHVHMVVNTIHPETGMTAPLKYTKERLSRWAEAYEREHGIHCEQRIENNERRKELASNRANDPGVPYVPVKHQQVSRKEWFEREDIRQRLAELRNAVWNEYTDRADGLWWRQQREWKAAIAHTKQRDRAIRADIRAKYKHKWRNLYYNQRKELRHVARISGNIFERAVFVFTHRRNLGSFDKPLTRRQMLALVTSGDRLRKRVAAIHQRDRRAMARQSKLEVKALTEPMWEAHKAQMASMKARQSVERSGLRQQRRIAKKEMTFEHAKQSLAAEQDNAARTFQLAPDGKTAGQEFHQAAKLPDWHPDSAATKARAEQIKRDMKVWRQRQRGQDLGREM